MTLTDDQLGQLVHDTYHAELTRLGNPMPWPWTWERESERTRAAFIAAAKAVVAAHRGPASEPPVAPVTPDGGGTHPETAAVSPKPHMARTCFTWGYSGRPLADLIGYMCDLDAVVVDIRLKPWSQDGRWVGAHLHHALGEQAALGALPATRLLYHHVPAYGNKNYKGGPIELADPERGWRQVAGILAHRSIILLCVCRAWALCHRRVVAEDLAAACGVPVVHLPPAYETWKSAKEVIV